MPDTTVFVLDNSYYAQNQDYLPTRYIVQLDIVNYALSSSSENHHFGVIPVAQQTPNYILTPTKNRMNIRQFISNLKFTEEYKIPDSIYIAQRSLQYADATQKRLVVFFSTPLSDLTLEDVLMKLRDCAMMRCAVYVFLFGDAKDYKMFLDYELNDMGVVVTVVDTEDNFKNKAMDVLAGSSLEEMEDPNLALALRLSAEEAERNKK